MSETLETLQAKVLALRAERHELVGLVIELGAELERLRGRLREAESQRRRNVRTACELAVGGWA